MRCEAEDLDGGRRHGSARFIGLGTALEPGRRLGCDMPEEVVVFAIEAADVETCGERHSTPVAAVARRVLDLSRREVGA